MSTVNKVTPDSESGMPLWDPRRKSLSTRVVIFASFASACSNFALLAGIPLMVTPPDLEDTPHPEAFPNYNPLSYNTAVTLLPAAIQLGAFFSNISLPRVADKIGLKPMLVVLAIGLSVMNLLAYLLRGTYWGSFGAAIGKGLFGCTPAIAMAYMGSLYSDEPMKAAAMSGAVMAMTVSGMAFGGMLALATLEWSIFAPALVTMGFEIIAALLVFKFAIDLPIISSKSTSEDAAEEEPLDNCLATNILVGALADNFGSAGTNLAMNPIMVVAFGVSSQAYMWVTTLTVVCVIIGAVASRSLFKRWGVAMTCVVGNINTAIVLAVLWLLAAPVELDGGQDPDVSAKDLNLYLGFFLAVLFIGLPFTVISQVTTSPLLLRIAPPSRRAELQGMNSATMQIGNALAGPLLGTLGGSAGNAAMMWTTVGLSVLAAAINFPLTRNPKLKKPPPPAPDFGEDYIPLDVYHERIVALTAEGKVPEPTYYGDYEADKARLELLLRRGRNDLSLVLPRLAKEQRATLEEKEAKIEFERKRRENKAAERETPEYQKRRADFQNWITDYLEDSGWMIYGYPGLFKSLIISAFPPITERNEQGQRVRTLENYDISVDRTVRVIQGFLHEDESMLAESGFVDMLSAGANTHTLRKRA